MNMIRGFILIAVSILLLKFAGANPIGSISIRSADSSSSPSDCDTTHPYCCNPPLNSPSLIKLFDELNTVITLLEPACTDRSFMENPPLRRIKFALDKKNEDKQNDFLNGAFELHMAIEERKKALCIIEEKKFYQGNNSTMEAMGECNLSCATTNVEKQIVLYLQANKCGCRKNGKINCGFLAKPRNEDIECMGDCSSLTAVTCKLWDSFNFMQKIIAQIYQLRKFQN